MKILVLADTPDKKYWDYYHEGIFDEFDLILSCGDLPPQYLSFIVTFAKVPVIYIHGNHDDCYKDTPPEGCICIEDCVYDYKGLRILGLGGSRRYKLGINQYTEKEMRRRITKLRPALWWSGGCDIVLTHSPIRHFDDMEDRTHQGFDCFNALIEKYKPQYFVHGHVHMNYCRNHPRQTELKGTKVINGYQSYVIEIPDEEIGKKAAKRRKQMAVQTS